MDSTVSVVMGTYNGARYVQEQLDSILAQTLAPFEVIVADDGSSDGTLDVVRRVAEQSAVPIIVIVNPQQLGFADNFLAASRTARGEYIAFSDQDDRWEPQKLELSVAALQRHDAVYCSHAVRLMDEHGRDLGTTAQDVPHDTVVEPRTADPWGARYGFTVTIRRELLDVLPAHSRGIDTFSTQTPLSHDRWAYVLAWSTGRSVQLRAALASYRQHPHQLYGGPQLRRLRSKVRRMADGQEQQLHSLALVARERSAAFDEAALRTAATSWTSIYRHCLRRTRVYSSDTLIQRVGALRSAIAEGAYGRSTNFGAGSKGLLIDSIFGLPGSTYRRWVTLLAGGRN